MAQVSASITAENSFTDWLRLTASALNHFSIRWRGLATTTVLSVQWRRPGEPTAEAITDRQFSLSDDTEDGVQFGSMPGPWEIRAGVLTGDFGSGTLAVDIFHDSG